MRHRVPGHQLGRPADQRKAVLRALATELLRHDEIETTLAKAKAVRSHAEKIITKGKHGQVGDYKALHEKAKNGDKEAAKEVARVVHLRRQVSSYLYDKEVVRKVFDNIAPRYKDRQGGYTRIIKIGPRRGDNSEMAIIQLV
ncbi:MAG: 50S ribosomal protein L17 [Cyanobacteria bacterium PR.023]|mgnify:CR=1 FL=1|jgi:large subunit ribosomal protein L17|nr:50S ribosomal protein L17 [Cyanobacteria bacterium PR.023]MDQ5935070.1 large subunit ribosomal protein [Cyanobacteriota bacterium erpe_2018_sw_21hr_WHONDRS-SW48-000092_B_bin.40]